MSQKAAGTGTGRHVIPFLKGLSCGPLAPCCHPWAPTGNGLAETNGREGLGNSPLTFYELITPRVFNAQCFVLKRRLFLDHACDTSRSALIADPCLSPPEVQPE